MPEPRFTIETVKRIYDEKHPDEMLEIGWSADGEVGDLLEIRSCSYNELTAKYSIVQRVIIHPDAIDTVIAALETFKKV